MNLAILAWLTMEELAVIGHWLESLEVGEFATILERCCQPQPINHGEARNSQPSKKSGGQLDSQGPSVFTPQINPPESWFEIIDKLTFCDLSEGSLYKSMRFFGVFWNVACYRFLFYSFCWNTPVELEFILSMLWKTERYSKFQSEANWPCYYRKISETSETAELKKTQPEMKKENHPNQKTKPLFKHVSFWGSGLQFSISL